MIPYRIPDGSTHGQAIAPADKTSAPGIGGPVEAARIIPEGIFMQYIRNGIQKPEISNDNAKLAAVLECRNSTTGAAGIPAFSSASATGAIDVATSETADDVAVPGERKVVPHELPFGEGIVPQLANHVPQHVENPVARANTAPRSEPADHSILSETTGAQTTTLPNADARTPDTIPATNSAGRAEDGQQSHIPPHTGTSRQSTLSPAAKSEAQTVAIPVAAAPVDHPDAGPTLDVHAPILVVAEPVGNGAGTTVIPTLPIVRQVRAIPNSGPVPASGVAPEAMVAKDETPLDVGPKVPVSNVPFDGPTTPATGDMPVDRGAAVPADHTRHLPALGTQQNTATSLVPGVADAVHLPVAQTNRPNTGSGQPQPDIGPTVQSKIQRDNRGAAPGAQMAAAPVPTTTSAGPESQPITPAAGRDWQPVAPRIAAEAPITPTFAANPPPDPVALNRLGAGSISAVDPLAQPDAMIDPQARPAEQTPLAQTAPTNAAQHATVPSPRYIVAQIVAQSAQPGAPLEIALDPPELGRVRLTLMNGEAGMVVQITAERADTIDLLRRHSGILEVEFQRQGQRDLTFDFSQNHSNHRPDTQIANSNWLVETDETGPASLQSHLPAAIGPMRNLRLTGLDVRF